MTGKTKDLETKTFEQINWVLKKPPRFIPDAEVGVRGGEEKGTDPIVSAGIGLRQQVGYQSVLDIGLQSDIAGGNGERNDLRFVAGYSVAF